MNSESTQCHWNVHLKLTEMVNLMYSLPELGKSNWSVERGRGGMGKKFRE